MSRADYLSSTLRNASARRHAERRHIPTPAPEPLVLIGQGDSQRAILPEHLERETPWAALGVLWLAFGVVAWLISLPRGGK